MESQHYSKDIRLLTYKFVESMIKRTKGKLQTPVPFEEVYDDACYLANKIKVKIGISGLQIKYHVRDNMLSNRLVFVNPIDVDSIFLTQKAIDKYNDIPMEKW